MSKGLRQNDTCSILNFNAVLMAFGSKHIGCQLLVKTRCDLCHTLTLSFFFITAMERKDEINGTFGKYVGSIQNEIYWLQRKQQNDAVFTQ